MNRRDFFKFGAAAAAAAAVGRTVRAAEMPGFGPGAPAPQNNQIWLMTSAFPGESFEDVIRNCISIGGDSDTIAAIAGGIAEAYYQVPDWMKFEARCYLSKELLYIVDKWDALLRKGGIQCA